MLVAAALLAVACSPTEPADLGPLQDRVATLEAALEAQAAADPTERVAALEEDLEALAGQLATATDTLATVDADLDDALADVALLLDAVTVLEGELGAVADELRGEVATLEAAQQTATSDLDARLSALGGRVDRAAGELEELRTLIVTVRDRLDRCQADGSC